MRALPIPTTLLTHSGTLHEQETCPFSAPQTERAPNLKNLSARASHRGNLLDLRLKKARSPLNLMFAFFPLDILQCQILLKKVDAQITPMRALPLQTTLLTHSGTLHEQETCPFSAPPTEKL